MEIKALQNMSRKVRGDIVSMIHKAGSGHPGGSLSAADLLVGLYFGDVMRVNPKDRDWEERDFFILSKGHVAPVLYSVLARKGFYNINELDTLRKLGSMLQGHPHRESTPGLDCSSGSLGQGLSIANGIALAKKKQNQANRVYCLLGDGELQEGQVWEAVMTAAQQKLDNVCAIVDYNHVQLDDEVDNIKSLGELEKEWAHFGWNVITLDGHDMDAIIDAYRQAMEYKGKPTVLIADTVKGKGVSFMEHDCNWHGNAPDTEQLQQALLEIFGGKEERE